MTKRKKTPDRARIAQAAQNCGEQVRSLLLALEDVRAELGRVEEQYSGEADGEARPAAAQQMEYVHAVAGHCAAAAASALQLSRHARRLEAQVAAHLDVEPGVPAAQGT
jgi:hypothetical protein